jgi:hypothetical protein
MAAVMQVDAGLAILTNRIKGEGSEPNYLHWGTGDTDPVGGDTALETPRAEARVLGTSSREKTNVANDTYQVVGTLVCEGTAAAITEVALFDAPTNGNMFIRGTFLPINLAVGDSIQFTVKAVYSRA